MILESVNLNNLRGISTFKVAQTLLRDQVKNGDFNSKEYPIKAIITAYILYKMQSTVVYDTFEEFMESLNEAAIKDIINKYGYGCWELAKENLFKFTLNELMAFILYDNTIADNEQIFYHCSSPNGILKLAIKLLDIKDSDQVLELCSGLGNFLVEMKANGSKANYTGIELNFFLLYIATFRASLIKNNYSYTIFNALEYNTERRFDKIFSHYPILENRSIREYKKEFQKTFKIPEFILRRASSDWLFNLIIMKQLKNDGKAVVIMRSGSVWNEQDKDIRQYFVENGYIETVITLPEKMFPGISVPFVLVVLSKNNESIKFIDAKDFYVKDGSKCNRLSDENINQIIHVIKNEDKNIVEKTIKELSNNDFILYPNTYLDPLPVFENGVEFETIIKNITRGSQLKADDLDEYRSVVPTNNQYLLLANINDGMILINNSDQYLKNVPEKLEKYCIKNNSIVFSKIGTPTFKSAVAQIEKDTKMVATGNMFVIELDETKANPYYIQAFLSSDLGVRILKNICAGANVLSINLKQLNKLIIPLPSLEEQNRIAIKYLASCDELVFLNRKMEKVKLKMQHLFDEEG